MDLFDFNEAEKKKKVRGKDEMHARISHFKRRKESKREIKAKINQASFIFSSSSTDLFLFVSELSLSSFLFIYIYFLEIYC